MLGNFVKKINCYFFSEREITFLFCDGTSFKGLASNQTNILAFSIHILSEDSQGNFLEEVEKNQRRQQR